MTKKILLFLLIFSLLVISGCNTEGENDESLSNMKLVYRSKPETEITLTNEQASYMVSIWENGEWGNDNLKISCPYYFTFYEQEITYSSEMGVFNDWVNNRFLQISKEERDYINSFIIADVVAKGGR